MALGVGTVAVRNTPLMLSFLESYKNADAAISLIGEGFDMLEEDYEEESFFADRPARLLAARPSRRRHAESDRRSSTSSNSDLLLNCPWNA